MNGTRAEEAGIWRHRTGIARVFACAALAIPAAGCGDEEDPASSAPATTAPSASERESAPGEAQEPAEAGESGEARGEERTTLSEEEVERRIAEAEDAYDEFREIAEQARKSGDPEALRELRSRLREAARDRRRAAREFCREDPTRAPALCEELGAR